MTTSSQPTYHGLTGLQGDQHGYALVPLVEYRPVMPQGCLHSACKHVPSRLLSRRHVLLQMTGGENLRGSLQHWDISDRTRPMTTTTPSPKPQGLGSLSDKLPIVRQLKPPILPSLEGSFPMGVRVGLGLWRRRGGFLGLRFGPGKTNRLRAQHVTDCLVAILGPYENAARQLRPRPKSCAKMTRSPGHLRTCVARYRVVTGEWHAAKLAPSRLLSFSTTTMPKIAP